MGTNHDSWSKLSEYAEELLEKTGVPGCSIGILQGGEITTEGYGISHIELNRPVSADTLFQIGSITKTFTATVAMKLVEDGKLDLHQPVQAYLPDFKAADPQVSAQVTPHHLLTHTAGWDGDLFLDTGNGEDAFPKYVAKMADREQIIPLGEYYSYNNAGFVVLGAILEKISGKTLEQLFHDHIREPLGLEKLFFQAGEAISYDFAVGHRKAEDGIIVARPWHMPRCVLPMGALVTNTEDLLKYASCYLDQGKTPEGKQILEPGTILDMFASKIINSKEDKTSIGYSWWRRDINEGYLVSHGGGTNGQITQLTLFPGKGFAFAIFTNSDKGQHLIKEINKFILKEFVDVALDLPKEIESVPEQLTAFEGTASRPGFKFYLKMMGDHLVGMDECTIGFPTEHDPPPPPSPPFRVGRCGEDRLIVLDGDGKDTPIDVFRNSVGDISHVRVGRIYKFNPEK
jgi:CubicO group peptidase (beta-lactamase class C family)